MKEYKVYFHGFVYVEAENHDHAIQEAYDLVNKSGGIFDIDGVEE